MNDDANAVRLKTVRSGQEGGVYQSIDEHVFQPHLEGRASGNFQVPSRMDFRGRNWRTM